MKIYIQDTNVFNTEFNESYSDIKAYKVMGIAIHTIGDIYAHRTLVREEDFTMENGALDWTKFKPEKVSMMHQEIKQKKLMYQHLNNLLIDKNAVDYEDDPQYRPSRMTNTRNTIISLILPTGSKDFTVYAWQGVETLKGRSSLKHYSENEQNYNYTSLSYTYIDEDDGEG